MKKILYVLIFLIIIFSGCTQEQALSITTDFTLTVQEDDYSVPVRVAITNMTEGADSYQWTFEGATPNSSTDRNPGEIEYTAGGTYTISLRAYNRDGSEETKVKTIQIDDAVVVDFEVINTASHYPPVAIQFNNHTVGATSYQWTFEGGTPTTSNEQNPSPVVFTDSGEHIITLVVKNGRETHSLKKIITVEADLINDFEWKVDYFDDDYKAPVTLMMVNNSISATSYQWIFEGAIPATSTEKEPTVTFNQAGKYNITLVAGNDKKSQTLTQTIEVFEDTNLRILNDIQLGINSARNTIGSFYSTTLRQVIQENEVTTENGSAIDIVFFGLNNSFVFNQFVSPDEVQNITFSSIPNAPHTIFVNSQELVGQLEAMDFTVSDFDAMINDTPLQHITIEETDLGKYQFTNEIVPRIVLFQTEDGRKGAIKIKEFVDQGINSYMTCDIKVQKLPN